MTVIRETRSVESPVAVLNLEGRVFMNALDFHAEATSEKQAMGCFLDGRRSIERVMVRDQPA